MGRPKKEKPNRKDGCYEIKATVGTADDGTPIRKSFYSTKSKEDARRKAEQYKVQQELQEQTGICLQKNRTLFSAWAREWLETYKKGKVKDQTYYYTYQVNVEKYLIPFFGAMRLQMIRQIDVQRYFNTVQNVETGAALSASVLDKHKMILSAIFHAAIDNDLCFKNPVKNIKITSKPKQERHVYTAEQAKIAEQYAIKHGRYDIVLLMHTGLRRSELLGLQWGDEGKGKVVDVLTPNYDVITRFQGGPNAGHTLEFNGEKYVLRSIPSGIFQGGKVNVIGNGVVLDPLLFQQEAEALAASGHDLTKQLCISKKAHLILPTHRILDAAYEAAKGSGKIGTTGKGIGPTYTDKISRNGLRVGDLLHNFDEKYAAAKARHEAILRSLNYEYDITELEAQWFKALDYLKQFRLIDSEHVINNYLKEGKSVLAEGAQGTMLDIDFGSYPFVTSSNTICAGCCTGLGVSPRNIGEVYGIFKAYCTRVGSGPFPTELFDETGSKIRQIGHEYGAVTGRERRCGWIDLVALKYAIMINGVTKLIMMKSDVLDGFDTVKACVAYKVDGEETTEFPFEINEGIEPVYVEMPGWNVDMTKMQSEDEFPEEFNAYISFLEEELEVPIKIVSVGPDREQTIVRYTEE